MLFELVHVVRNGLLRRVGERYAVIVRWSVLIPVVKRRMFLGWYSLRGILLCKRDSGESISMDHGDTTRQSMTHQRDRSGPVYEYSRILLLD